jgi:hypothetical protein
MSGVSCPILSWWRTKKRGSGPLPHRPGAKPCHPPPTPMVTPSNDPKRKQEEEAPCVVIVATALGPPRPTTNTTPDDHRCCRLDTPVPHRHTLRPNKRPCVMSSNCPVRARACPDRLVPGCLCRPLWVGCRNWGGRCGMACHCRQGNWNW